MVIGLKGDDVQSTVSNDHASGILCRYAKSLGNASGLDVDDGDLILRGERHISLMVIGKNNSDGLIESRGFCFWIKILDGIENEESTRTVGLDIDDRDRVRDVICDPKLFSIRTYSKPDRFDPYGDHAVDPIGFFIDYIDCIVGSIRYINKFARLDDRVKLWTHQRDPTTLSHGLRSILGFDPSIHRCSK